MRAAIALTVFLCIGLLGGVRFHAVLSNSDLGAQRNTPPAEVTRNYDEVTDTTFIRLRAFSLQDDAGRPNGFTLHVFASFAGDTPRDPVISLGWFSTAGSWRYSDESIQLIIDNIRRVVIGPLRHEWTTTPEGEVFNQLWGETTVDMVAELARATRVQGTLGKTPFVLTPQQLESLRALATSLRSATHPH